MKKIDKRLIKAKSPLIEALRAKGYGKNKGGKPLGSSRSKPLALSKEVLEAAEGAASLALPDYIIAAVLGISAQTMVTWGKEYPEFVLAISRGRAKRVKEIAAVENKILDGTIDEFKYPAERSKMADRLINRLFPENIRTPIFVEAPQPVEKSKAQQSFEAYKEIHESVLTDDKNTLILSKKGQL